MSNDSRQARAREFFHRLFNVGQANVVFEEVQRKAVMRGFHPDEVHSDEFTEGVKEAVRSQQEAQVQEKKWFGKLLLS